MEERAREGGRAGGRTRRQPGVETRVCMHAPPRPGASNTFCGASGRTHLTCVDTVTFTNLTRAAPRRHNLPCPRTAAPSPAPPCPATPVQDGGRRGSSTAPPDAQRAGRDRLGRRRQATPDTEPRRAAGPASPEGCSAYPGGRASVPGRSIDSPAGPARAATTI